MKPRQEPPLELDRQPARNAAREILVRIIRVSPAQGGGYKLIPVHADQHAVVTRTRPELGRGVLSCFTEVEAAAYARFKKQRPDLAVLPPADADAFEEPLNRLGTIASPVLAPRTGHRAAGGWASGGKREQDPADYVPNPDGSWTSPKGKRFTAPSMVHAIIGRRLRAGLPIVPVDCVFDLTQLSADITRGARRDGQTPHEYLAAAIAAYGRPSRPSRKREVEGQLALELPIGADAPKRPGVKPGRPARRLEAAA